jgi:hypothetical protein
LHDVLARKNKDEYRLDNILGLLAATSASGLFSSLGKDGTWQA